MMLKARRNLRAGTADSSKAQLRPCIRFELG